MATDPRMQAVIGRREESSVHVSRRRTCSEAAVDLIRLADLIESGDIEALESARLRLLRVTGDVALLYDYVDAKIEMSRARLRPFKPVKVIE